jgi:hypothetical protein|tara:strand:- start:11437 stop:11667 length:231 start_codon:yes stop_codon:yes gene_type:complete
MIKLKSEMPTRGIEIDLTGPDGNAYFLMGTAKRLGREIGMSPSNIDKMIKRMTSGDYEHLVSEFEFEFGSVVTLLR